MAGEPVQVPPQHLIWLTPGVARQFWIPVGHGTVGRHRRVRVRIFDDNGFHLSPDQTHAIVPVTPLADECFTAIIRHFRDPVAPDPSPVPLLLATLAHVMREGQQREPQGLSLRQRQTVQRFLHRHLPGTTTPAALAEAAGLSLRHFTRRFGKTFGMPPRRWIKDQRMRFAADMLEETSLPVADVGQAMGIASPAVFSRQFREVLGSSPQAWRNDRRLRVIG